MDNTTKLLLERGVITEAMVLGAERVAPHVASSKTGKLVAAGADAAAVMTSLSQASGIPIAPLDLLASASPVLMLPSTAKQLKDIVACPIKRDAQGTLHVAVADPDASAALDKMLVDFKVYLAPEVRVRSLLQNLYSIGTGGAVEQTPLSGSDDAIDIDLDASRRNAPASSASSAAPPEAIDIDLDASQRMQRAPGPAAASPASEPSPSPSAAPLPADPFAPRASGPMKVRHVDVEETQRVARSALPSNPKDALQPRASGSFKRPPADEETQRIVRAPAPPLPPLEPPPSLMPPRPSPSPIDPTEGDDTMATTLPAAQIAAVKAAFVRGIVVGASVMLVLAVIAFLATR